VCDDMRNQQIYRKMAGISTTPAPYIDTESGEGPNAAAASGEPRTSPSRILFAAILLMRLTLSSSEKVPALSHETRYHKAKADWQRRLRGSNSKHGKQGNADSAPAPCPGAPQWRPFGHESAARPRTTVLRKTDLCFSEHDCSRCRRRPGCAYCAHGQVSGDISGCYNKTRFPDFCSGGADGPCAQLLVERSGYYDAPSVEACHRTACVDNRRICRVSLADWLSLMSRSYTLETFPRMDVIMKVVVADGWIRGDSSLELLYSLNHPLHDFFDAANTSIRMLMFRGLVESAAVAGFDWQRSPLSVWNDFRLKHGQHRAATALALGYTHIFLEDTSCSTFRCKKVNGSGGCVLKHSCRRDHNPNVNSKTMSVYEATLSSHPELLRALKQWAGRLGQQEEDDDQEDSEEASAPQGEVGEPQVDPLLQQHNVAVDQITTV